MGNMDSTPADKRILVVDDEPLVLLSLRDGLTANGLVVDTAHSVEEARSWVESEAPYDYLLVDLNLDGGDGGQLIEEMRKKGFTGPVIAMSGHGSVERAVRALKAGSDDLIQKPFSLNNLMNLLRRVEEISSVRAENLRLVVAQERAHEMEKLNRKKLEFFRFTSHELKAPLVAVQSILKVVDEVHNDNLSDVVQDLVGRALTRSDQLMQMINDMLDISRDESAEKGTYECMDLLPLVRDVVEVMQDTATQRKIEVKVVTSAEGVQVRCNRGGLEKAVANLLSNGIRYTPEGGTVTVDLGVDEGCVVLCISDTGIGIPAAEQERVFNAFFRASNARRQAVVGTGLGLSLVQKVVAEHGGQIELQSEVGAGTTFTIRLPIGDCDALSEST